MMGCLRYRRLWQSSRIGLPSAVACALLTVVFVLLLPDRVYAQATATPANSDSARAALVACEVVQALRASVDRYRCRVDSFQETATEYVIRVREFPRPGHEPPEFSRSHVRLDKIKRSVIVTRWPDL